MSLNPDTVVDTWLRLAKVSGDKDSCKSGLWTLNKAYDGPGASTTPRYMRGRSCAGFQGSLAPLPGRGPRARIG